MIHSDFSQRLYGLADQGWLAFFYFPSKQTQWFALEGDVPPLLPLADRENVYLNVCPRKEKLRGSQRGTSADVIGMPALWLDLDFESVPGAHKVTHPLPSNEDEAIGLLESAPCEPSLIIHTGHGLQAYWIFSEMWIFESDEEKERAGFILQGWQMWFVQEAAKKGWHVDRTFSLTQVLRVPGSYNRKVEPHREVVVLAEAPVRYEPSDFSDWIPLATLAQAQAQPAVQKVDLETLPISNTVKKLLVEGPPDGRYPSRSEFVMNIVTALIEGGATDETIVSVLMCPDYPVSSKPIEQGVRWLNAEILRLRNKPREPGRTGASVVAETPEDKEKDRAPFEWIDEPDLRKVKFPPLKWYAKDLLYQGIVILAGRPKKGKSYLATLMSVQLAGGHPVLGQYEVNEPVKTVYFTLEDGPELIQDRIKKMSPNSPLPNLRVVTKTATISDGFMDDLNSLISEGFQVFVIDVLTKIETRTKEGAKTYAEIYEMFEALQKLRNEHSIAVLFVYHTRKMKGESDEETIMGSTGYSAVTDANWILKVDSDEGIAWLTIDAKRMRSRTIEMKTAFEGMGWTVTTDGKKGDMTSEQREVIEVMKEDFPEITPNQLGNALGIHRNTAIHRLRRMWKRGHVEKVPRKHGVYRLKTNTFENRRHAEDDLLPPFS